VGKLDEFVDAERFAASPGIDIFAPEKGLGFRPRVAE
jgi:hypothetical protein